MGQTGLFSNYIRINLPQTSEFIRIKALPVTGIPGDELPPQVVLGNLTNKLKQMNFI